MKTTKMEDNQVLLHIPDDGADDDGSHTGPSQFHSIVSLDIPVLHPNESIVGDGTSYYIQQPDGTRMEISFLPNGDIDGALSILPDELVYEPEVSSSTKACDVDYSTEALTFLGHEPSTDESPIQATDSNIFYIEAYTMPESSTQCQSIILTKIIDNTDTGVEENTFTAKETPKIAITRESAVQVIGSDLAIEDRMRVMDTILPRLESNKSQAARRIKERQRTSPDSVPTDVPAVASIEALAEAPTEETAIEAPAPSYKCDMCHKSYRKPKQLYGHSSAHSDERALRCSKCSDMEFTAYGALSQHERRYHYSVRHHQCSLCDASFDRASQLGYHMRRVHMEERAFACQLCSKSFFKRSDLKSHVNIHLGLDTKVCETCGKVFNHVSNLNRHIRTHTGVRLYACVKCGRRFTQTGTLARHKLTHEQPRVACLSCDKSFRGSRNMQRHVLRAHKFAPGQDADRELRKSNRINQTRKFYCRVCGQTFPYATLLKNHESVHVEEKTLRCSGCERSFPSMDDIVTHACGTFRQRGQEVDRLALEKQLENLLHSLQLRRARSLPASASDGGDIMDYITPDKDQQDKDELDAKSSPKAIEQVTSPNVLHVSDDEDMANLSTENEQLLRFAQESMEPLDNDVEAINSVIDIDDIIPPTEAVVDQALSGVPSQCDDLARLENGEVLSLELESGEQVLVEMADKEEELLLGNDSEAPPNIDDCFIKRTGEESVFTYELDPDDMPVSYDDGSDGEGKLEREYLYKTEKTVDIVISVAPDTYLDKKPKVAKKFKMKCDICSKEFNKRQNYKQHLGTHFADQKQFECKLCNQSFAWKSTLNKHIMKCHSGPRQKIACEICGKEYLLSSQVHEHIQRDHHKLRPHECNYCHKVFYRNHDLTVHLRTHTGTKPYVCGTCGKSFSHSSHIIRHEQIHSSSGNARYSCDKCGRRFTQATSLRVHERHPARCFARRHGRKVA